MDQQVISADSSALLAVQLQVALAACPPTAPIVVMVHGYRYDPGHPASDPHRQILALTPERRHAKAISWPRHLGYGHKAQEGLAIGFGWQARGTIWQAQAAAERAGAALAALVRQVRAIDPTRRVDMLAHSLGARVVLSAAPMLPSGSLGRVVLMTGAEFGSRAVSALHSPAGRAAQVFNITTRENDLFDFLTEALLPAPRPGDRTLGHGLPQPMANWIDLQIDQDETLAVLARLGHRIAPPHLRVCHWSSYLRPGLFGLYRALLAPDDPLTIERLHSLLPSRNEPRWSRLLALPDWRAGLPFGQKTLS